MEKEHPLLQHAQVYPRRVVDLAPTGCRYDDDVGAWRVVASGRLWVETPNREGPRTKKNDIETGEDQKGE